MDRVQSNKSKKRTRHGATGLCMKITSRVLFTGVLHAIYMAFHRYSIENKLNCLLRRRFFYGPGINNFDVALHKIIKITESKTLELRFETFNTFNHAQFYPNGSVDGNIDSPTFGHVLKAAPPRIGQVALKFNF